MKCGGARTGSGSGGGHFSRRQRQRRIADQKRFPFARETGPGNEQHRGWLGFRWCLLWPAAPGGMLWSGEETIVAIVVDGVEERVATVEDEGRDASLLKRRATAHGGWSGGHRVQNVELVLEG